jgi:hypothetical protein
MNQETRPLSDGGVVRQVVRGERPPKALESVGVFVSKQGTTVSIEASPGDVWRAEAADLATGLWAHRGDPEALRAWAQVILGGSTFLELNLEESADHNALLEALWDAAFLGTVQKDHLKIIERLAASDWPGRS